MSRALIVNREIAIPGRELGFRAVRASGPGGQNVNKVASKVELRFELESSQVLAEPVKARLRVLAGRRLGADGALVIVVQETRDQIQNLELARARLAAMIRAALVPPKRRRATRPTRAAKERRLTDKKALSKKKHDRARPTGND